MNEIDSVTVEVAPEFVKEPPLTVHWLLESVVDPVRGPMRVEALSLSRKMPAL